MHLIFNLKFFGEAIQMVADGEDETGEDEMVKMKLVKMKLVHLVTMLGWGR